MPLSNTTQETLRSNPYWDDFNPDKQFHRVLWKPRTPVQTRELNQIQSMLQNQVEQVTTGVFREGAATVGGQQVISNTAISLRVIKQDTVDITNYYNANTAQGAIVRGATSKAEGIITQVFNSGASEYAAFIINPITSAVFIGGETVDVISQETNQSLVTMVAAPNAAITRAATTFSVNEGTFFLRGHLVSVHPQTVVLSEDGTIPSKRIGFYVTETIVTSNDDTSLLDPALGTTNYAAPGADRLRITATLTTKPLFRGEKPAALNADDNFIEIARVVDGVIQPRPDRLEQDFIETTLARRTYDESGDYVVRPFRLISRDHNPPLSLPNITGYVDGIAACNVIQAANVITTIVNADGTTDSITTLFQTEMSVGDTMVVRGERREITAILSNTVLTINSAFSETFTNEIATIISPNKLNLELEAGKAYVRGYEFETFGTTKLEADRARTTEHINNGYIGTNFGPFVYVTLDSGLFDTSRHELVDLHNVTYSGIVNASANSYTSSKIGTARVRSFLYDSGIGDANTVYKMYLVGAEFDTKTYTVTSDDDSDSQLTEVSANVNSLGTFVMLTQNTSTTNAGSIIPYANNAYTGGTIKLYTKTGQQLVYAVQSSTVSNSTPNKYTHVLVVDGDDNLRNINALADVVIIFNDKCIRGMSSNIALTKGTTTDSKSKVRGLSTGNTLMQGASSPGLLYRFREGYVNTASITDESYSLLRYYTGITSANSGDNFVFTLTANTDETPLGITDPESYISGVAITSTGAPVRLQNALLQNTTDSVILTIPKADFPGSPDSVSIDTYLPVAFNSASPRSKILVLANTDVASVNVTGGNITSNLEAGHIAINVVNASSSRIVGLGVSDVYALQKVYAVKDTFTTAINSSVVIDVTDRYVLDNGQRDWCYDHASLVLKPTSVHYTTNAERMIVMVDHFTHSALTGNAKYFTAESYLDFESQDIPKFINPKTGIALELWNYVDFRPVRAANTQYANTAINPYVSAQTVFEQTMLPLPTGSYTADYETYLPRIDKIVLTKDKVLRVLQGTPARQPEPPPDDTNGITLYLVSYPPYTANASLLNIVPFQYKRYTMKDIGKLEKRIENLEYYAALSTLDLQTANTPEYDENDIERFKNGIITDSFVNQAIANFRNPDTKISIDRKNKEMRPSYDMDEFKFEVNLANSEKVVGLGILSNRQLGMVSLPFTTTEFLTQGIATSSVNINPFNVVSWVGSLSLLPPSDTWIDVITKPTVVINAFNENDGLQEGTRAIHTDWRTRETTVTGAPITTVSEIYPGRLIGMSDPNNPHPDDNPGGVREQWLQDIVMTTPTTHTQMRQATVTYENVSYKTTDLGEKVIDTAVVPKMRGLSVDILADGLYPGCLLRASFDDIDITSYVERANMIHLDSIDDAKLFRAGDIIQSSGTGIARILGITDNILHVVDAKGTFPNGGGTVSLSQTTDVHVPERDSSRSVTGKIVALYVHWSGTARNVSNTDGNYTITLDAGASSETDATYYVGKTIHFTDGGYVRKTNLASDVETQVVYASGIGGLKATIASYNGTSKVATLSNVSNQLKAALDAQIVEYGSPTYANPIRYSIGQLRAESTAVSEGAWRISNQNGTNISPSVVNPGMFFGLFRLPGYRVLSSADQTRFISSQTQFNTGTRVFKLQNVSDNTTSYAISQFTSSGSTITKRRDVMKTREITYRTETKPEEIVGSFTSSGKTVNTKFIDYIDPLAQTFLVSAVQYPYGIFVTHLDLFFAKKGSSGLPVTVQIRETVNGFPSADGILTEGRVTASNINVVPEGITPSVGTESHRTRVYFDEPLYLAPNAEYAIVILANTQEYELFVSEIGKPVIGSTAIASEQALGGVLFKSQNARTWSPEQTQDLMFVLHRAEFKMEAGYVEFQLANSVFNIIPPYEYDVLNINTGELNFDRISLDEQNTRRRAQIQERNTNSITNTALSFSAVNLNNTLTQYPLTLGIDMIMPDRKKIAAGNKNSLKIQSTLRTSNSHVSPIFDIHRISAIAVKNRIDNGQLYANGFVVTQPVPNPLEYTGSGDGKTYALTVDPVSGTGMGAQVQAITNSTGYITSITVVNPGSGYIVTPNISMASNTDFTTQPSFAYIGETSSFSAIEGEQKARYITRTVTLAEGFDAGDLKVYLSASRSQADNIDVYYKVLATGDPQRFDDKTWTLMTLKPGQETLYSTGVSSFREYEYRTENSTASYTYGSTTFDRFHSFAIKVVLRSTNTTIVPRVRNLRVIALDE